MARTAVGFVAVKIRFSEFPLQLPVAAASLLLQLVELFLAHGFGRVVRYPRCGASLTGQDQADNEQAPEAKRRFSPLLQDCDRMAEGGPRLSLTHGTMGQRCRFFTAPCSYRGCFFIHRFVFYSFCQRRSQAVRVAGPLTEKPASALHRSQSPVSEGMREKGNHLIRMLPGQRI